jgi:hypothetical protein
MTRPRLTLLLSLLFLASTPAAAQRSEAMADSAATTDDAGKAGQSWLVALLRKVARRSEDSAATADSTADNEESAASAAPVRATTRYFRSRRDSLEFESARAIAERATGYRIAVDMFAHALYVINQDDTLRAVKVATASNATLAYGGRTWRFETPRGLRHVLSKDKDPKWMPPEWHFAEVALEHRLKLRTLERGQVVRLRDGTRLTTQGDEVGIIAPGTREFVPLVLDEHVVFDNTLFVPPLGTKHRSIEGELGHFRLALGDGYQLHGTPYTNSIGSSATHGCVRMGDEDIEWLYENVPVGTKVYFY